MTPTRGTATTNLWHHHTKIAKSLNQIHSQENKIAPQSHPKRQHSHSDKTKFNPIPKTAAVSRQELVRSTAPHKTQDRQAFSAAKTHNEDEEEALYDSREYHAFSASRLDSEDQEENDREDCYAMMGQCDYDFNGSYEEEDGEY